MGGSGDTCWAPGRGREPPAQGRMGDGSGPQRQGERKGRQDCSPDGCGAALASMEATHAGVGFCFFFF